MRASEFINWINADPLPGQQWMRQHYSHFDPYNYIEYYLDLRKQYKKKIDSKEKKVQKRIF